MIRTYKKFKYNYKFYIICAVLSALAVFTAVAIVGISCSNRIVAVADPASEAAEVQKEIDELAPQLDVASQNYGQALMDEQDARNKVEEAQSTIDNATEEIIDLQKKLAPRLTALYKGGGTSSIFIALLDCTSFNDFQNALSTISMWASENAAMVAKNKELRETVEEQKTVLDENLRIASEKSEEAATIQANTQTTLDTLNTKLANLSAEAEAERQAAIAAENERARAEAASFVPSGGWDEGGSSGEGGSGGGGGEGGGGGGGNEAIVARAESQIGKPYIWGACGPDGFDCSGLVSYACTGAYCRIGTTYTFMNWPRVSNPSPGNICTSTEHCGIYVGGGSMCHAPQPGECVKIGGVQGGMIYVCY